MNNSKIRLEFRGSSLQHEDKEAYIPKHVVYLFIFYELDTWVRDLNTDFALGVCLFEAV